MSKLSLGQWLVPRTADAAQWDITIGLREAVIACRCCTVGHHYRFEVGCNACGCCTVGHHYRFDGFKISSYYNFPFVRLSVCLSVPELLPAWLFGLKQYEARTTQGRYEFAAGESSSF